MSYVNDIVTFIDKIPYADYILCILLICACAICLFYLWKRLSRDEASIFWGLIKLKPNKKIEEYEKALEKYKAQFEEINQYTRQKNNILKAVNDVSVEMTNLMSIRSKHNFSQRKNKVLDMILFYASAISTKQKDDYHRVTILLPDSKDEYLRAVREIGYGTEKGARGRLPIKGTFAGNVYHNGKANYSGDIENEKTYLKLAENESSYKSLACIPIKINGQCCGVLNVDGRQYNSFSNDDLDNLHYFANVIAGIFKLEELCDDIMTIEKERRELENEKEKFREGSTSS